MSKSINIVLFYKGGYLPALPMTTLLLAYLRRYNEIAETSGSSEEYILREAIDTVNISRGRKSGEMQNDAVEDVPEDTTATVPDEGVE